MKKRFRYCVDPSSPETLQYIRAIQGHSGGDHIDPALQGRGCYRTAVPSTSITLEVLMTYTPSSSLA